HARVPGGAQSGASQRPLRRIGLSVKHINCALIVLAVVGYFVARHFLWSSAFNIFVEGIGIFYLAAIAVGWFSLWLDTARLIRFVQLKPGARALVGILLVALLTITSGGTGYGAFFLNASTSSISSIFGSGPAVTKAD